MQMSNEAQKKLEELLAQLRQERDELRVRAHLLKAELKQEWDEVERKWDQVELRLGRVGDSARESAGEIGAATSQLGEEIANAYRRIRDSLR
jgi:predicted  nucleic acid-binding Zn-ribbon protein